MQYNNNCINHRWIVFGVKEEGTTDQTMTIEAMWSEKEVEKVEREMLTSSKYTFGPDTYIRKRSL